VTPVIDTLVDALAPQVGSDPPVVRVIHLAEVPEGRLRCVECIRGDPAGLALDSAGRHRVRERGLSFWVDAGLGLPYRARPGTGLFLDQRENRRWLAALAGGGRWLNLFCHTGAFSVALLAAGAASVTSVDLSAQYLAWLADNLQLNGLSGGRHQSVKMDARRFLERGAKGQRYHGIILDPPTAAAAGRRFWSVRRQGHALIASAFRRLRPGGVILVCRNDRSPKPPLVRIVLGAAKDAGRKVARAVPAPPGPDFPTMKGFPEGDAFRGLLVWDRSG
jgi:23S rRNA G2069 N7-methylase RlmK/C1962 C5-methylase RlmI